MSTAAILAGGRARRLGGRPKALLPLGKRRIIDRQINALRPVVDEIVVIANDPEIYAECGIPVRTDMLPGHGPLSGLHTALLAANSVQVLVLGGDMPFVTTGFLKFLLEQGRGVELGIPYSTRGYQPLCASYQRTCAAAVERQINSSTLRMGELIHHVDTQTLSRNDIAPFDPDGTLFFNVNTSADYARALGLGAYYDS